MKQTRIVQLAGVLVVLVLIAYLTGVFDSAPSTIRVPTVDVPVESVESFQIQESAWTASLALDGGVWRVTDPVSSRADSMTVGRLLDSIGDLELNTVVSTSRERHGNYGVDAATARLVTLSLGDATSTFHVSAQGPDFSSSYVRLDDGDVVYSSSRVALPTTLDQLRDKTMASIDPAHVIFAEVQTPDGGFELNYGADGWGITRDGMTAAGDSTRIAAWLRRYSPLRLDGFEDALSADSVQATHRVVIRQMTGNTIDVLMGTRGDDMVAHLAGSDTVMRAFGSRLESLVGDPADLTADN